MAGGPIVPGTPRNFFAAGTGFSGQGGVSGSRGVPFGPATAVVINLVAVGPAGPGDLRAYPFGAAAPLASIINYTNLSVLNIANGVAVAICDLAMGACPFDLTVQADVSSTDLVVDILGYFAVPSGGVPLFAVVDSNGTLARGLHAVSATRSSTGTYQVRFDRNIRNCAYVATIGLSGAAGVSAPGEITVVGEAISVNGVFLTTLDSAGATADRGFHLHVLC